MTTETVTTAQVGEAKDRRDSYARLIARAVAEGRTPNAFEVSEFAACEAIVETWTDQQIAKYN